MKEQYLTQVNALTGQLEKTNQLHIEQIEEKETLVTHLTTQITSQKQITTVQTELLKQKEAEKTNLDELLVQTKLVCND